MNSNTILFGLYPYMAAMVCVVGCWIRYDREQYSWKAGSSQVMRTKGMRVASNAFHVGILFVLAGHFVGLLMPEAIYHHVISTPNKQLLAMVSGGVFGALCFVGMTMLIVRRFTDERVQASSSFSDNLVLVLLYIQLILGLSTIFASSQHMDGSVMVMLADWAQSIVLFRPMEAATSIAPVGLVYKLHVFLGMTLFLIFPFTRLVHIISGVAAPVKYLLRSYQIVRRKRA
ncbi:MAG: respiratory nitrate reductase subunit gamma [Porticoccus sp.]|nr:respiratory nitrate reductase subunit gamma [Porticoccus sp.]MBQ0807958.1 respiratory nitrate reductase subunit gamma [Porticoccus sp.]